MKNKKEKFTPRPWLLVHHPEAKASQRFLIREQKATVNIAAVFDIKLANAEANAHLIAAAPEMFEALESILEFLLTKEAEGFKASAQIMEIEAALSKARGEGES